MRFVLACVLLAFPCVAFGANKGKANCYSEGFYSCNQVYQKGAAACRSTHKDEKTPCSFRRIRALAQCEKHRTSIQCRRKVYGEVEKKACRSEYNKVFRACAAAACTTVCRQSCQKKLQPSNIGLVKETKPCFAKAALAQRKCKHVFVLNQWKQFYQCKSKKLQLILQCRYNVENKVRNCKVATISDLRTCIKAQMRQHTTCMNQVKRKCQN